MKHLLEADSIQLEFGQKRILTDIYFKCTTGSITGLLGRNGQGKTSLMNVLYGTLRASGKSVRFDDATVSDAFKKPDLLTYLPQVNFIPDFLSVRRVFMDFAIYYPDFIYYFPEFKGSETTTMLNLSNGQRRLVEVYIIIKSKSQFTMLDEPFSHLSPLQVQKIKAILREEKQHKGFLISDHLYKQIVDICDDLYILKDGKMHLTKEPEDIESLGYARL